MSSRFFSIITLLLSICVANESMALNGSWRGDLNFGPTCMPLVFNFESKDGKTEATMDSPQQNAKGIPLEVLYCSSDSVSLDCKMIGASFSGKISEGKIEGFFIQRGFKLPLTLSPELDLSERRPQTPRPPFPYSAVDTTFASSDGVSLAGTLVIPEGNGDRKYPVVVMITGSGPQNRDEEIFEHRPFAVISDYLARNGIASFRYDDRGTALSKGDYSRATIETFKNDAKSALKFVRNFPQFDRFGILGHSEGGSLAVLIASEDEPDFVVSLAGMVTPAKETLLDQNMRVMDKMGFTQKQKEDGLKLLDKMFDEIASQYGRGQNSPIDIDIDKICKDNSLDVSPVILESVKWNNANRTGYFDSLVSLDPTEALKVVKCRVLAINGSLDTQVNADANLAAFRNYVKDAEIKKMEGLNHLLQHAVSGDSSEYGTIRETISPEVLQIIAGFINGKD